MLREISSLIYGKSSDFKKEQKCKKMNSSSKKSLETKKLSNFPQLCFFKVLQFRELKTNENRFSMYFDVEKDGVSFLKKPKMK